MAIVTPAQGSRNGYENAKKSDGQWDKDGVYMFSELERSADTIIFTYMPPEMGIEGQMKIGTCKSRRSADVPAQIVSINKGTSRVSCPVAASSSGMANAPTTGPKDPSLSGTY